MTMLSFRCTVAAEAEIRHRAEVLGMTLSAYLVACAAGPATEAAPPQADGRPSIGDRVKDRLTGYTGIVITRAAYMNGTTQSLVQPEKPEQQAASAWVEDVRLAVADRQAIDAPVGAYGLYL